MLAETTYLKLEVRDRVAEVGRACWERVGCHGRAVKLR
jgi:hypothetical protein